MRPSRRRLRVVGREAHELRSVGARIVLATKRALADEIALLARGGFAPADVGRRSHAVGVHADVQVTLLEPKQQDSFDAIRYDAKSAPALSSSDQSAAPKRAGTLIS